MGSVTPILGPAAITICLPDVIAREMLQPGSQTDQKLVLELVHIAASGDYPREFPAEMAAQTTPAI